ncbi:hypothetical protein QQS21_005868 [Conoideocrella luteorostrata]|uniref:Exo-beta-1,3-glucanase n=1 Tax=Conoideocrella luteorostrata TaxID=1105319 RepID=A0AAJ0CPQ8_9HYPO|nr:hypothetical protein QQS21_005868 [Conoideocrella luteorostrata]
MRLRAGAAIALACLGTALARDNATDTGLADGPKPPPSYMVDNQHNWFHSAPDKGSQNGAVWLESGSLENYTANARHISTNETQGGFSGSGPKYARKLLSVGNTRAASSSYWLPQLAAKGKQPYANGGKSDYKVFRNVVDDFKADNTGEKDATEAINAAILDGNRCGQECGNTFSQGAIVYFPAGTYKICRPIVQLYYTQLIGDPNDRPIIKGCDEFQGIALIDTDPYIPGGGGQNWYINQNQFFRQIRNFVFDLTDMPLSTADKDQQLVPTGIHWQVSQACSLQNLKFKMPIGDNATHVGIFMENGSGGFVSDLEFEGGNIAWRAGSQQYTAINLKFKNCLTAVQMVWDWGFNWQRIEIDHSYVGFNISGRGGDTGQGIGSVSIIDCKISNTPTAILTRSGGAGDNGAPNIVLDNLQLSGVDTAVKTDKGDTLLSGGSSVDHWTFGKSYNGTKAEQSSGEIENVPKMATSLKDGGKLFYRARPQYETASLDQFLVATDEGCSNDGTGDNADAINAFLQKAKSQSKIAFFPAGVYRVGSTVTIPVGSVVQGSLWSQIQGAGVFFSNMQDPQVVVKVGEKGDKGKMEIVEMIFGVQGATAGAIVLEWNIHEGGQGSAAMWDSHVRVGGATGSSLDFAGCPRLEFNENCICASMLFHVTPKASGYFENMWVWLADHDNDMSVYDDPDPTANQISLYAARGTLIESQGPSWFYGTGSEHAVLYQYQLHKAKDVYLGHIQSETPYYQPDPLPPRPFDIAKKFPGDPDFSSCKTDDCKAAWGLRIVDSEGITIHSAGLYSFFQNYKQFCVPDHNCQERICEVKGSKNIILYNVFTVGSVDSVSGINNGSVPQKDTQNGFSTEISVWRPLDGDDETNIVYIDTTVWEGGMVQCSLPCTFVLPTSSLPSPKTLGPLHYTIPVEWGSTGSKTLSNGAVQTVFSKTTSTLTVEGPAQVITKMSYSNIPMSSGAKRGRILYHESVDMGNLTVSLPDGSGGSTSRVISLPPWPHNTYPNTADQGVGPRGKPQPDLFHTPITTTLSATGSTVLTLSFPTTVSPVTFQCPPSAAITFNTPATVITPVCDGRQTVYGFTCPGTKLVTFLGPTVAPYTVDCTLSTSVPARTTDPTTTSDSSTTTPPPVWTDWPGASAQPVTTDVTSTTHSGGLIVVPCRIWFFNFCPRGVKGWKIPLPTGTIGPGPPPPDLISRWTIEGGRIPPWPKITIHPGPSLEVEDEPEDCKTETVKACADNIVTMTSVDNVGSTHTESSTSRECASIYGCSVTGTTSTSISTTKISACPLPTNKMRRSVDRPVIEARDDYPVIAPPGCPANALVFPRNPESFSDIKSVLDEKYSGKYDTVGGTNNAGMAYVLFYFVNYLDSETFQKLKDMTSKVKDIYYNDQRNSQAGDTGAQTDALDTLVDLNLDPDFDSGRSSGLYNNTEFHSAKKAARDLGTSKNIQSALWSESLISYPAAEIDFNPPADQKWPTVFEEPLYTFFYHAAAGTGQTVYVIGEYSFKKDHSEFTGKDIKEIKPSVHLGVNGPDFYADPNHGTAVVSKIVGNTLGSCPGCSVRVMVPQRYGGRRKEFNCNADYVSMLNDALNDIKKQKNQGRSVINMSWIMFPWGNVDSVKDALLYILKQLNSEEVSLVASSGNDALREYYMDTWPSLFGAPDLSNSDGLPNLITAGATDKFSRQWSGSQYADWITTHAEGHNTWVATDASTNSGHAWKQASGTSFSAPQVAGLVAYLRSLPSKWQTSLQDPANVKKMVQILHRRVYPRDTTVEPLNTPWMKMIWNGQIGKYSCLVDYDTNWPGRHKCPFIPEPADLPTYDCNTSPHSKRDNPLQGGSGGTCLSPGSGSDDGGSFGFTDAPTPDPICPSGTDCGGRLCKGYWCDENPVGPPPGSLDPKDPENLNGNDDGGDKPILCQVNSGCKSLTCPKDKVGVCSGGYCKCSDRVRGGDRECYSTQSCQGYSCASGQGPDCIRGYCTCRDKSCSTVSDCGCDWNQKGSCTNSTCTCIGVSYSVTKYRRCLPVGQGCAAWATLYNEWHEVARISNAHDGCRSQKPFQDFCIDEQKNRLKFTLENDVPRCLTTDGQWYRNEDTDCPEGNRCSKLRYTQVQCNW